MTKPPQQEILEANHNPNEFSDAGNAFGIKGHQAGMRALEREPFRLAMPEGGFNTLEVDLSWDTLTAGQGVVGKILSAFGHGSVDLDLGCLYELEDGRKGCLQAFGKLFGAFDDAPYIRHSGDERTGQSPGADESFTINGAQWNRIKRLLVYAYIYKGVPDWSAIRVECTLRHGAENIRLSLAEANETLPICALLTLENDDGGVMVTRRAEYFQGHPEMDRAYGYGLKWEEGSK